MNIIIEAMNIIGSDQDTKLLLGSQSSTNSLKYPHFQLSPPLMDSVMGARESRGEGSRT